MKDEPLDIHAALIFNPHIKYSGPWFLQPMLTHVKFAASCIISLVNAQQFSMLDSWARISFEWRFHKLSFNCGESILRSCWCTGLRLPQNTTMNLLPFWPGLFPVHILNPSHCFHPPRPGCDQLNYIKLPTRAAACQMWNGVKQLVKMEVLPSLHTPDQPAQKPPSNTYTILAMPRRRNRSEAYLQGTAEVAHKHFLIHITLCSCTGLTSNFSLKFESPRCSNTYCIINFSTNFT